MRLVEHGRGIAVAFFLAGIVIAAGCGPRSGPATEMDRSTKTCVMNMAELRMKAASASMAKKDYDMDRLIPMGEIVPDGRVPVCPAGTQPYAPFTLGVGPVCPNSETHTKSFRDLSGQ